MCDKSTRCPHILKGYISKGTFALTEKPKPIILDNRDAIVKVTLASICSSDLHIKHGSVPRAVEGITVGQEMVGNVEEGVKYVKEDFHTSKRVVFSVK